jgi:glutathione synthase
MRHVVVMDPVEVLNLAGDSTFTVQKAAVARGHEMAWCVPADLYVLSGRPLAEVTWGRVDEAGYHPERREVVDLADVDVVWMRKDPPFDMSYIFATYILDMIPAPTLVVNAPAGLKLFNEKIWAMHFARFQPPTLLSGDMRRLRAFVENQEDGAVLKPWDGNGGRGVVVVRRGDRNLPSLLELLTRNGADAIIAQAYLPGVTAGDKRILLFDGEPVAAINRVPGDTDHRANMHVGGAAQAVDLTPRDLEICAALGPELRRHGQVFVGIDVIAGMLTEINVTSPTGLVEARRLYGVRLEEDLLDRVTRMHAGRRAS